MSIPLLFPLESAAFTRLLCQQLGAERGEFDKRSFPDGETSLRVTSVVEGRACIIVANLTRPDARFLPLCFLATTLRELGATQVGLVAPYLCYMRQDKRFNDGEAVTSRIFAELLSTQVDWLVTVDPHLHRYHVLDEIYPIPSRVVHGAPVLAEYLRGQRDLLLVGPDVESEQWVAGLAAASGHPFVIGTKVRSGDRAVEVQLPDLARFKGRSAVIVDDVVASGYTLLQCFRVLRAAGFTEIDCACVHGLFAEHSDRMLLDNGIRRLITTNTLPHPSNNVDVTPAVTRAVTELLAATPTRPRAT
ncbi:MAG: hypothetical protein RLZZ227_899 [Pseudomonadota bacterium]|jgi:ribose-phosphate pyrophosphokinase